MDLEQIAAAVVSGALTGAAMWWRDRRKSKLDHAVPAAAVAQIRQTEILRELCDEIGGCRAVLLKAHNGGSIPHGGSSLKVTILAEATTMGVPCVRLSYQARPITDTQYLRLIRDVDRAGLLLVRTRDLEAATMLRDEYERANIASAYVAVVLREPERWYYLSVQSVHEMKSTPHARAVVRAAAARLSRLCVRDLEITLDEETR
jgi:hypothetical protein